MRWKDRLKGGTADRLTPAMFPVAVLKEGTKHELEHTTSRRLAMEIAMDHLAEDINYYRKLKTIENPSTSRRQQQFMCAEYGRKRRGQRTRTGMSTRQLKEFCMARTNPAKKVHIDPPLSASDKKALTSYLRGLRKDRPRYFEDGFQFEYRGSTVTITETQEKRAKNPHLRSGRWQFVGMFEKRDISGVKRILKIHGIKCKVTTDHYKKEQGQRELYVEKGAFDTAYRAITRLYEQQRQRVA